MSLQHLGHFVIRMAMILLTCTTAFSQTTTEATECSNPQPKDCGYYRQCLETEVPCGPSGYAVGYGELYCKKFETNINYFSKKGQSWIWSTMLCLQNALVPIATGGITMNCSGIETFAFNTHPKCYTSSGQSICDLPVTDWIETTYVIKDTLNDTQTWKQISEVAKTCSTGYYTTFALAVQSGIVVVADSIRTAIVNTFFGKLFP